MNWQAELRIKLQGVRYRWGSLLRRLRLDTAPNQLLLLAFLVVLSATAAAILLLPPTGWPLWGDLSLPDRLAVGAMLLSTLGLVGFFVSVAAGIAELNHAIPSQFIHFAANCSSSSMGRIVTLHIVNGSAFVEFPFVQATGELWEDGGKSIPLQVIDSGPWELDRSELTFRDQVLYPKQMTRPAAFQVPAGQHDAEIVISIVWSSERSAARVVSLRFPAETQMGDYA